MKLKKVFALAMATSMVMGMVVVASAAPVASDFSENAKEYHTDIKISTEALQIDVTVPTTITPTVDKDGNPSKQDITITNNSHGKVHIVDAFVTDIADWNLTEYGAGVTGYDVNSKNYILQVNNNEAVPNNTYGGDIDCSTWDVLNADGGKLIAAYDVNVSPQSTALKEEHIGTITLIVDWYEGVALDPQDEQ